MPTIAELLQEIINQRNALANNLVTKGVSATTDEKFNTLVPKVLNIESGIDTSDATATAADIKQGLTAYANGEKITGTAYTRGAVTAVVDGTQHWLKEGFYNGGITIPGDENLIASNIKKDVTIYGTTGTLESSGLDTSDATATSNDILSGKTAYVKGTKVTGDIASKAEETYTPGLSDTIIQSGVYLSGNQIISGDSNLIPSNIKKGVSIFGIEGNFEGSSSSPEQILFECALDAQDTDIVAEYSTLIKTNNEGVIANLGPYVYNTMCAVTYTANNSNQLSGLSFKNESEIENNGFYFITPLQITSSTQLLSLVYYISAWITPSIIFHFIKSESIDLIPDKIQNKDFVYSKSITLSSTNNTSVADGEKKKTFFEFKAIIGEYYLYIEVPRSNGNDAILNRISILNI